MNRNLLQANREWATRPADQRFWSLDDLHRKAEACRQEARVTTVASRDLVIVATEDSDLRLRGKAGIEARLTNYSFCQLAGLAGAPGGYLASLPAELAARNLNHGLEQRAERDKPLQCLFRVNGAVELRCATSDSYTRIWNRDVTERLRELPETGWRVPPARPAQGDDPQARPATASDVLDDREGGGGLSINLGDMIAPAGLYASDRDMFVFMVNEKNPIEDGRGNRLSRGFFCWNSEVGDKSFGLMMFLYAHICGNHIVWGADDVREVRIRHVGSANRRAWWEIRRTLSKAVDRSAEEDAARIRTAQCYRIAGTKEELLDTIFKFRWNTVSRKTLELAYQTAERFSDRYGDPRTAWGFANGLTQLGQGEPYAEERVRLDRAAGRILAMAF
jgi:hypothetical protein